MPRSKVYVLKAEEDRRPALLSAIEENAELAEAVPEFEQSRNVPMIAIASLDGNAITHLGMGRRGVRSGTGLRRLNIVRIKTLADPVRPERILERIPQRIKRHARAAFARGGLVGIETSSAIIDALLQVSQETQELLTPYGSARSERVRRIPTRARVSLAQQKDAITTALSLARMDRSILQTWNPVDDHVESFLDGLESVRIREDAAIAADMANIPGYNFIRTIPHGAALFTNGQTRLTVVLGNRQALEQQLGVDLVYFNETHKSFVLVQYKMLEESGAGPVFRLPNGQLTEEIARMDGTSELLDAIDSDATHGGFRLLANPFFLKLCPRVIFDPDSSGVVPGKYLPLELWRRIESSAIESGENGRGRVLYRELDRYIDNDTFVRVVEGAWVGSTGNQSEILVQIVRDVVEGGKAVVLAVKSDAVGAATEAH